MKLTIHLLGQARQLAATDCLEIDLPEGASVDEALPTIFAAAGSDPRLAAILRAEDGTLRRSVLAILREEAIDPTQPNLLVNGDTLTLLPPMSGG